MQLIIDDKHYNFTDIELYMMYISEGCEGRIYNFNDLALKIYHEHPCKPYLSEEECERMKNIPTKRILLPKGIIYDVNNTFVGFYRSIVKKNYIENASDLTISIFVLEANIIYHELEILSSYGIKVNELFQVNFCYSYDKKFYFIDPGSYKFVDLSYEELLNQNRKQFSDFLVRDIFCNTCNLSPQEKLYIRKNFKDKENICDILLCDGKKEETVVQYIKRLVR